VSEGSGGGVVTDSAGHAASKSANAKGRREG